VILSETAQGILGKYEVLMPQSENMSTKPKIPNESPSQKSRNAIYALQSMQEKVGRK
jgi:hypothetical protein